MNAVSRNPGELWMMPPIRLFRLGGCKSHQNSTLHANLVREAKGLGEASVESLDADKIFDKLLSY